MNMKPIFVQSVQITSCKYIHFLNIYLYIQKDISSLIWWNNKTSLPYLIHFYSTFSLSTNLFTYGRGLESGTFLFSGTKSLTLMLMPYNFKAAYPIFFSSPTRRIPRPFSRCQFNVVLFIFVYKIIPSFLKTLVFAPALWNVRYEVYLGLLIKKEKEWPSQDDDDK